VLISGASGGVGVAGVQIARTLGAHVIAVTRTNEHHDRLRALGARETITVDELDTLDSVDVILELVGAAHLNKAQRLLNPFARVVIIGVSSGSRAEIDLLSMMRSRSMITGSTLRSRSRDEKADVARLVGDALIPRWTAGELEVPVDRVFDLSDAAAAYDYFAQPGKFGKVVLRVEEPALS